MAEAARQRMTYTEYRQLDDHSQLKHEFVDGAAVAMTGGSFAHATIVGNVYYVLRQALADRRCTVVGSEARVLIPLFRNARYPDASVVCGDIDFDDEDPDAITNPVVLVEVLSEGTEAVDRGEKFREYRTLESLRHYLLISQDRVLVERYTRADDGSWVLTEHGAGDQVELPAAQVSLPVDGLYERTGL